MSEREVLWKHERPHDLLSDLRELCRSLDGYQVTLDVHSAAGLRVSVVDGRYELGEQVEGSLFRCPECSGTEFVVLEGVLKDKSVLGLACTACETYGIVCPGGL